MSLALAQPQLDAIADKGRLQANPANCANCIKWRTACQSNDGQLYPKQGLVFEAVEHTGRSVRSPEEIDRLCRISSQRQGGGVH